MISNNLNSEYVLVGKVPIPDANCNQFGQNINWLSDSVFTVVNNLSQPTFSESSTFTDGTYFDGGSTNFGNVSPSGSQEINIFQVLETDGIWINSFDDILKSVSVKTISVTGKNYPQTTISGFIDNLFLADVNNPDQAIKIYNNPNMSPGWVVQTSQEYPVDPGSISRAWLYDSITKIKLTDLEVVDLFSGVLPGSVASEIDFSCDIDPACYNVSSWGPGIIYNIGDRVNYGGQLYQALYAGKSGSVFNPALWSLIGTRNTYNLTGSTLWGASQVGKTWFNTNKLKAVNAQLGSLHDRALNWNQWFPNSVIIVNEWISSSVPPAQYVNNDANGFVVDSNCPYVYDSKSSTYYFWVSNKNSLGPLHNQTSLQLSQDISDIPNSGIPMVTAIAPNAIAVYNINQYISSNTNVLHIDYVTESANSQLHSEFALISNDGSKSWYNTPIYPKLIDSLSGVTTANQLVPDINLPASQQVGILNNPTQSLFVDRVQALKIYYTIINSQLANLAVSSSSIISALSAFDPLPTTGFNEQIPNREVLNQLNINLYPENYKILLTIDDTLSPSCWSIVAATNGQWQICQHQIYNLANNWKYSDWYSTDYSYTLPNFILNNAGELSQIAYQVGDIIQIDNIGNNNSATYKAVQNSIDSSVIELEPIYIQNGTIQFLPNLFDFNASGIGFDAAPFDSQGFDNDPYIEIRLITRILNDIVFVGSDNLMKAADDSFYAIVRYILFENDNLDWLFKTSFVTVDYPNRDLGIQGTFEPDNQNIIEDFVNETTPFHTRIREFRDIYSSTDYGNIGIVDFDLPAQFDNNYYDAVMTYSNNPKDTGIIQTSMFTANVGVNFNSDTFFIFSNGIPNHATGSSNEIVPQSWGFGLERFPIDVTIQFDTVDNTTGPIAVAINGVPFYSPNSGTKQNLYLYGNVSFPLANVNIEQTFTINTVWEAIQNGKNPGAGFTNSEGAYQYYANPYLAYTQNANSHSPLIGYAWDGNPIYGPYGYANPDGSGGVIQNTSSYQLKTTPRLDANGYPVIHGLQLANYTMPTGQYIEDYEYIDGLGTLDYNNGRLCVTPEYPSGTYAYFVTVSPSNNSIPVYPYVIGPAYHGQPYGLTYTYINGINTPIYKNGSVSNYSIPLSETLTFVRTPDGSQSTDSTTLAESIYLPWTNHKDLARTISTTLRFDRVNPNVEYISSGINYPIGSVVYANGIGFIQAITANANISTVANVSCWVSASSANIDTSTAVNRITANYVPTSNMFANQARLLISGADYPGVIVDGGSFVGEYNVPSGSIFDEDDPYAGITSLNISWRPGLISDTILNREYSRFNGGSCEFNAEIGQYLKANSQSPSIGNIAIGSNDFTLEFFVNFSNTSNLSVLVDTRNSLSSPSGLVVYYDNGNLCLGSNTEVALISANIIPFSTNSWQYIAINGNSNVYSTGNIFTYMNGVLVGNIALPYNYSDTNLILGADVSGNNVSTGFMDELRLTVHTNRYALKENLDSNGNLVSFEPFININIPEQPFPRTIVDDKYFEEYYTPILCGFESLNNESPAKITFIPVNSQTIINDLSWNRKSIQLINYGSNVVVDSSTLNTGASSILAVKLNQGGN